RSFVSGHKVRSAVAPRDTPHVVVRFPEAWHSPGALDQVFPGIVGSQAQYQVIIEHVEEIPHVLHAAAYVLLGIEAVADAQARGGSGHELHQPSSTFDETARALKPDS